MCVWLNIQVFPPCGLFFPIKEDTLCVQTSLEEQQAYCFLEKEKPRKGVGGLGSILKECPGFNTS